MGGRSGKAGFRAWAGLVPAGSEAGNKRAHIAYTNLLASGIAGKRDWPAALARLRDEAREDAGRALVLARIEAMDLDERGDPAALPPPDRLSARGRALCRRLHGRGMRLPARDRRSGLEAVPRERRQRRLRAGSDPHRRGLDDALADRGPAIHAFNRRLAALSGTTPEQGEALQLLRYRPGRQYHPHVDWDAGDNGRIKTALVYLNEDYEGGETLFVKTGLKVKGRTGDVLVFASIGPDGGLDPLSEHAGLPVETGVKYLASRWIHARPYRPSRALVG